MMIPIKVLLLALAVLFAAVTLGGAASNPLIVDSGFCAINGGLNSGACLDAALNAAEMGSFDAVLMTPGVYVGCSGLVLTRHDLLITTADYPALPPADSPGVIWACGGGGDRHLAINGGTNVTIAGIGFADSTATFEGGMVLVTSSVMTFDRCRFENSTVVASQVTGGTLHVTGGAVSIRGCVFRGNYIRTSGGAIFGSGATLILEDSLFVGNEVGQLGSGNGAAVSLTDTALNVTRCTFLANRAYRMGGVLYTEGAQSVVFIKSSTFEDNYSDSYAGAISSGSPVTVTDSVFRNNSAGLYGGVTDVRGDTQTWHNVSTYANHAVNGGVVSLRDADATLLAFDSHFANDRAALRGGFGYVHGYLGLTRCLAVNSSAGLNGGFAFHMGSRNAFTTIFLSNSTVAGGTAPYGGCLYINYEDFGEVRGEDGARLVNCSADQYGGGAYVISDSPSISTVSGLAVEDGSAAISGGGIFVTTSDAGADVLMTNLVLGSNSAGSFGGGLAVTAAVVPNPGRGVLVVGCTIEWNTARRGGGISTATFLAVEDTLVYKNTAMDGGGGIAFQPPPCGFLHVNLTDVIVQRNDAGRIGGGIYALSSSADLRDCRLLNNYAPRGGGLGVECDAELCMEAPAREETDCAGLAVNLTATKFINNKAGDGDGGAVYVGNQVVAIRDVETMEFKSNVAGRGGVVFTDYNGDLRVVTPGGNDGRTLTALLLGADVEGNNATAYGPLLATPVANVAFVAERAPADERWAGQDLCPDGGCLAALTDDAGNAVTTPLVVEVFLKNNRTAFVDGTFQRYVLAQGGLTSPISDLAVAVEDSSFDFDTLFLELRTGDVTSYYDYISIVPCGPGWGSLTTASGYDTCGPCDAGTFSSSGSSAACLPCPPGTTTGDGGGASTCAWCAAGFGWESGECAPCPEATFAPEPTLETPCAACADGLTTSGDGAVACSTAAATFLSTSPAWVLAIVGGALLFLVVCVGVAAWRFSRRRVISNYYIDEDATVTIDDRVLAIKIDRALQDSFAKRIGGGEFTDIYRVREKKDVYVLKLLKVNLEGSGTARAEFDSEARILAQLQARVHPGVIRARFFTSSSPVCIGLDYCEGGALKDHLARTGLSPKDKLMFATQIASSMAYVHAKGIAHLDLKTANILLSADATRTVVADFGISQTQDGPPTVNPVFVSGSSGAAVGSGTEMRRMASNASSAPVLALTPHYCAPERLTMKDLSFSDLLASDVYTYGVVVWAIYAQVEPFAGVDGDEVMAMVRADPGLRHECPAWMEAPVAAVVGECWDGDTGARPDFAVVRDRLGDLFVSEAFGGEATEVYL